MYKLQTYGKSPHKSPLCDIEISLWIDSTRFDIEQNGASHCCYGRLFCWLICKVLNLFVAWDIELVMQIYLSHKKSFFLYVKKIFILGCVLHGYLFLISCSLSHNTTMKFVLELNYYQGFYMITNAPQKKQSVMV